ncbi:hypothetical protein [Lactobacillus kefiranofaciens]|uniref:hypothetical protein n=1 Tax=Lactobacillus kefiranofaciens TaxID=267818 RepID=UPI0021C2E6C2|nr:hypothetical protein [Lactobacillus kefiranofaciens]MCP9331724.1 hypothetical protein [Lactobacillus kefiranofaciens]
MKENRLVDLYDRYPSQTFSALTELDRENLKAVEPLWQKFLKIEGYTNEDISRDEFGDLCLKFMLSLRPGK